MNKATALLQTLEDLTFETYIELSEALSVIDDNKIDDEMARQPAIYAYYSGLLTVAHKRRKEAELNLERYAAETWAQQKAASTTKQTARDLDAFVKKTTEYSLYTKCVDEAYSKYTLIKSLVTSLEQKKDMLVQRSSNRRAETNLYR